MFSIQRIGLICIIFFLPLLIVTSFVNAEKHKEGRAFFQGQVIGISKKFITVERTSIALPQKTKILDVNGTPIALGTVKKGDYVMVTIEKNEATIQLITKPGEIKNQKPIPE